MNAVAGRLDIDSRVASKPEPDLVSALERAVGKQPPKFREQRRERLVGSRGKRSLPQRVGELVTAGDPVAVDGQICEQEATLPARQLLLDPPPGHARGEAPAELDARRVTLGHSAKLPGGWTIQLDGLLDQL